MSAYARLAALPLRVDGYELVASASETRPA